MESTFGIEHFLTNNPGFSGIVKHRYQDFIVHEIDESGNVVVLTDLKSNISEEVSVQQEHDAFSFQLETLEQLQKLESSEIHEVFIDCQNIDKVERTKIHITIRERYKNLDSATVTIDGVSKIKVTSCLKGARRNNLKRSFWPNNRGDFCKFVLYKENKDSGNATGLVAKFLNIKSISVAGTKDRRAVTSQLATAYRVEAEKLAKLNETLYGIRLGNFEYCPNEIFLGSLKGNRFTIILRNVDAATETVEQNVQGLKEKGFINYYGTQRFGTTSVPTHRIGKAIIQKKWSEAVDLLLSNRKESFDKLDECYNIWTTTKDASQALAAIPAAKRDLSSEGMLLKALKRNTNDFSAAFRAIPRNTRNLYVHSFQSLLWNKLVSKRIANLGDKLIACDLVLKDSHCNENESNVKQLTEDDLNNHNIFDMVLPLFSSSDCLPKNAVAEWYSELLDEESVTWEQLKSCSKEYALHGGYRRMLMMPDHLEHKLLRYDDPNDALTLTDLNIIEGKTKLPPFQDGKYLALKLEFSLPSGCYATMVLRELTKCDSSKFFQATLNNYAKANNDCLEDNNEVNVSI